MTRSFVLAAGAAWAALLVAAPAQAEPHERHLHLRRHAPLPPISGTLHLDDRAFGSGRISHEAVERAHGPRWPETEPPLLPRPAVRSSYGRPSVGRFVAGQERDVPPAGYGLAGAGGALPYGVQTTGWGTADSATTGGAYPLPSSRYRAEMPLRVAYGEPDAFRSVGQYGYPATGGLAYYNSGSTGRMAYYGSSSSAGPGGTPGGLGIYSSGSYGPGPEILYVGHHRVWHRLAARGPHIIHVGSRRD